MSQPQERRDGRPARRGGHGPGMQPVEKAKDFKGTIRRLAEYLRADRLRFLIVVGLAVLSTVFSIVGPKILGMATTKLGEGVLARWEDLRRLETAIQNQAAADVVQNLRQQAALGFDFEYIARILLLLIALYVFSAACTYAMAYMMASVAQLTVYRMRNDVKAKLDRLPLKYFDQRTHGEILSRITNDMDNIANTLQQSLTQLITSLVSVLGMVIMMLIISPLMTLIALVSLPLSIYITTLITKRSQGFFRAQQKTIGELNGHVEEMYGGHKIVKAFGHEQESIDRFQVINQELYRVGWRAQFISGIIFPLLNL
ncbi:MAG: ABC transporter ATP-binding protein, partial [Syntrophomonas sp.]|nr:ABC transporter ATP-binding protein [Syntrophomonas sp.]